jgi:tetratricopeptide (TPR) repeat protein
MSHWPRFAAAALLALVLAAPRAAVAQPSPAERAEQLNDEGRKFVDKQQYDEAASKFRQAIVLSPEGRFYFNLCVALYYLNKLRDAITACEAVEPNGASIPLIERAQKSLEQIRAQLAEHGDPGPDPAYGDPDDPDYPGDPDHHGDPGVGHQPRPDPNRRPPPLAGVEQQAPQDEYKWSLGGELGFVGNSLGADNYYADGGISFRGFINFPVLPAPQVGLQGFLGVTHIGANASDPLQILDLGGALYWHMWSNKGIYLTALGGVHGSFMQPESFSDEATLIAMGFRGELQAAYRFGPTMEHGLTATLGLTGYTRAVELTAGASAPDNFGLHKGGSTIGLTFGYTYHFSTPFGSSPIFVLE